MKHEGNMKKLLFAFLFLTQAAFLFAQSPQAFQYQAVVRNSNGEVVANDTIAFRVSILQTSIGGTAVYTETHTDTTNQFGLITLAIGNGTVESGDFSAIEWGGDNFYLKVEMDIAGGTNYENMGTSQLLSVPYALHSGTTSDSSRWIRSGDSLYVEEGNVGIGTASPQAPLDVKGDMLISEPGSKIDFNTNSGVSDRMLIRKNPGIFGEINVLSDHDLRFRTDDQDRMTIKNNGYVGIGTTEPVSHLHLANAGSYLYENTQMRLSLFSDGGSAMPKITLTRSHSPALNDNTSAAAVTQDGDILGRFMFNGAKIHGNGGSGSGAGWFEMIQKGGPYNTGVPGQFQITTADGLGDRTTRLVVNPVGYVGIGTDDPSSELEIRTSDPDDAAVVMFTNSDQSHFFQFFPGRQGNQNPWIMWGGGDPLRFISGTSERLRIAGNGYIGIGTTAPTQKLDVHGNIELNGNQIKNFVIDNRTSDPSNPSVGQMWIRTDL